MTMPIKMYLSLFKCSQKDPKKQYINKLNRKKLLLISKVKETIKIIKGLLQIKMEEEGGQAEEDQEVEEALKMNKWTRY